MTHRFLISVAAATLIAGTSFASAQGMGHEGAGMGHEGTGPAAQQGAPAEHSGTSTATGRDAKPGMPSSGMKSTQSEQKPPAAGNQRAEEKQGGDKRMGAEMDNKGGKDMKAEGRDGHQGTMGAENKGGMENKSQTTGQAAAGGKLSSEQRTKITTVIRGQHVAPVTHVNFSVSVGTRVPREEHFYPLPAEVITYYPEWRGYEFIMVNNQIVVVDPRTFEIVAVLDA
ncbi:MAG TPA: DUF1236 domain-containing protein [Burkholderiales bacterium]|jgi:hypothetical protein|nr:DUF1236 domain-containing protein [Burkholderiales bacterium]